MTSTDFVRCAAPSFCNSYERELKSPFLTVLKFRLKTLFDLALPDRRQRLCIFFIRPI